MMSDAPAASNFVIRHIVAGNLISSKLCFDASSIEARILELVSRILKGVKIQDPVVTS